MRISDWSSDVCSSDLAEDDFLAPEVAFQLSAQVVDAQTIALTYKIADGYYLYRERFAFKAENAQLGEPDIPPGTIKFDETFQTNVQAYRHTVTLHFPVPSAGALTLRASSADSPA